MNVPKDIFYTKDHEWVRIDGNHATIGITDFAQHELGDLVFIEVETMGEKLAAGEVFGTIEAVKTVSDLFMPVNGKITQFNNQLENKPEIINADPYGEGWIIKIELSKESNNLLTATEYQKLIT